MEPELLPTSVSPGQIFPVFRQTGAICLSPILSVEPHGSKAIRVRQVLIFSLANGIFEVMPVSSSKSGRAFTRTITIRTSRRTELKNVTAEIQAAISDSGCANGTCLLYVPHTTAGVLVNEGDDPAVARDIEAAFDRLVPRDAGYKHLEGNADSHIKTALAASSESIWIENGQLALGRWQAIFFAEFDGPRTRELRVKIIPDDGS